MTIQEETRLMGTEIMKAYRTPYNAKPSTCYYLVSDGLSSGEYWFTVKMMLGSKSRHRVVSKELPIRKEILAAQADLDVWAAKKKLVRVVGEERERLGKNN